MDPRGVVERVLDELESGDTDVVERSVVRTARVAQDRMRRPQVGERLEPGGEDGLNPGVGLAVDPRMRPLPLS